MAKIDADRKYTEDHEWAYLEDDDVAVIGIDDYAQAALGDIVMVELPDIGDTIVPGAAFGSVESPKSVSDLFSPLSGEIIAVNGALEDEPEIVNDDCYGAGWFIKIQMSNPAEMDGLMDAAAYATFLERLEEDAGQED